MGRETILFKTEEKMNINKAANLLRELADKLESQKVILKKGNKEVKLSIPETVELEIKAEREDGKKRSKKKLEIEIEWVLGEGPKGGSSFTLG